MDEKHIPKPQNKVQFCWNCQGVTEHIWSHIRPIDSNNYLSDGNRRIIRSTCRICNRISIWINFNFEQTDPVTQVVKHLDDWKRVYPLKSDVPKKNKDMPEEIGLLYDEAAQVLPISPKSTAALLRLALQKLMTHLDEPGKNINADIGSLVGKGVPKTIQEAMDTLRVIGNEAVHPGQIDFNDNTELAIKLFDIVNLIIDYIVSKPEKISSLYYSLPSEKIDGVRDRDKKVSKKK